MPLGSKLKARLASDSGKSGSGRAPTSQPSSGKSVAASSSASDVRRAPAQPRADAAAAAAQSVQQRAAEARARVEAEVAAAQEALSVQEPDGSTESLDTLSDLRPGLPSSPSGKSPSPPGKIQRQYSVASQQTVDALQMFELQLFDMERSADDYKAAVEAACLPDGVPLDLRNKIAQLYGNAGKLLATKVDAVLTAELNSGQADARAKRKALSARCEALMVRTEAIIKQHDAKKKELGQ